MGYNKSLLICVFFWYIYKFYVEDLSIRHYVVDILLLFGRGQELHSRPSMQETAASFLFGGVCMHESNAFSKIWTLAKIDSVSNAFSGAPMFHITC